MFTKYAGRKRGRYVVSAVLATALAVAVYASGSAATGASTPYKVVFITSLTGADAPSDVGYLMGTQAALDEVNATGGVNGTKIQLSVLDDQSSPTQSVAVAREALTQNPLAIIDQGDISSRLPVYNQSPLPVIAGGQFTFVPYVWAPVVTFKQAVHADIAGLEASLHVKTLTGKKIALFGPDASAYHFLAGALTTAVQNQGGTVVTSIFQPFGSSSFSAGAAQIIAAKPDAVMGNDTSADIVIEARGLAAAGFKAPIVIDYAATDAPTLKEVDLPNMLGEMIYQPPVVGTTMYKTAQKFHLGNAATTGGANFGIGWASAYTLVDGLKKCGANCSHAKLESSLNALGYFNPPGNVDVGPLHFTSTIHQGLTAFQLYSWNAKTKQIAKFGKALTLGPPS